MKVIVFERPDGGVSIIYPAPLARLATETEDGFVQRIRGKDVPDDAVKVEIMDAADLPPRESRNQWRLA